MSGDTVHLTTSERVALHDATGNVVALIDAVERIIAARIEQARAGEGALRERVEAVLADGDHDAFCDQDEECECWRRRIRAALDTAGDPT